MYFSDRERGPRARDQVEIDDKAWRGIISLIERKIDDGSLGYGFPEVCQETGQPYGTDRRGFGHAVAAEIPEIEFPFDYGTPPDTLAALDLLEFCHRHIAQPFKGSYHSFFKHDHLTYEQDQGQAEFRKDANRLLARQGLIYELGDDGLVRRIASTPAEIALESREFHSSDQTLNQLLSRAKRLYFSPNPHSVLDALKELWDAWERLKTVIDPSNKKQSIQSLIHSVGTNQQFLELIDLEANCLTKVGNEFQIRHHEVGKYPIKTESQARYFYQRLYALIELLLPNLPH